ncbi:Cytochrome P450, partial [Dillenia turbinata]
MESSSLIFIIMAWLVVLSILSKILNFHRCHLKLPPGPKPWPITGNLNLLGPLPHQSLHKLSQRYGPLMQLRFGSYPVIVASNAEMAKQILRTHDPIFASRPPTAAGKYTTYNYSNITWAPCGPHWRLGRKIFHTELFSSKRLESYEYIRVEEMRAFVCRLYASCGKAIVLKEHLSRTTLSIISRIVLGKKYFSESKHENEIITHEELQEMFDELFFLNGVLNIGDWIPWIGFLDLQGYVKRMKAVYKKLDRFYQHVLDEHRARRAEAKKYEPKDMVDLLLQLADDPSVEVKLTFDGVKGFTQDLIAGGTDTSANALEWAMSELLKHPYLIDKATEELDRVIGRQRWVEEKDTPNLPYIDAIMKETMRLHPALLSLGFHFIFTSQTRPDIW